MANYEPYEILTGVGELYAAPVGTAFPAVNAVPAAAWVPLGKTQDGVTITLSQSVEKIRVDQETGPVKATRAEEDLVVATKLANATLENMARVMGKVVTDTPPGAGTIGTREMPLYRGQAVPTMALLFRGTSAYGDFPAQYELPVGFFDGDLEQKYTKDGNAAIGVEFTALVDPDAATDATKFGRLVMQDAAAL